MKNNFEDTKKWYEKNFEEFESRLNGVKNSAFHKSRIDAFEKFTNSDFPTLKDEEWKYTNIAPIADMKFKPYLDYGLKETPADIDKLLYSGFDFNLAVFINGRFSEVHSRINDLPKGVVVGSLAANYEDYSAHIENYFGDSSPDNNIFTALNGIAAEDGLFVYVPKNTVAEKPLQVIYFTNKNELLSSPKNILIAEENSQIRIIQNYAGEKGIKYFTNSVMNIFAAENAVVDVYKIQNENMESFHIDHILAVLNRRSVVNHFSVSFGGLIVRNDIDAEMKGETGELNLSGLYLGSDNQHIDNHTFIDHAVPNCESSELYKGILDDFAHGVFGGKILVRQDAQKTNAFQSNKTILLTDTANIDTKPQLEIYADDVKCSHGATVGQLDKIAEFYIRSRGIPADIAKSMLIRAFANDVIETVKIESLKENLNHQIFQHLNRREV